MKKFLTFLSASVIAASSVLAAPWNMSNLQDHVDKTNFILDERCSGTLVDLEQKLILTAYHCVSDKLQSTIEVKQHIYKGSKVYSSFMTQANVVAGDQNNDIALIQLDTTSMPYNMEATISQGEMLLGQDLWVVGNPLGSLDNSVTKGILGATHRMLKNRHVWQIDANVIGGSSGGGVYNTHGELIGVTSAGMMSGGFGPAIPLGFNFITPLEYIQKLVFEYKFESGVNQYIEDQKEGQ